MITRLEGGAGALALHGARVLDPADFEVTIIAGSGGELVGRARQAGLEVVLEPSLRTPVHPARDLLALRRVTALLRERSFDVVHTHTAKAGAVGRLAADRAGAARIVHTYHGFPFHEFQSRPRRAAYVAIERKLGAVTDVTLCVGAGVAAEAVRRGLAAPQRVQVIGVAVDTDGAPAAGPAARARARRLLGLPGTAIVVGAVGRLTYQKAPEDFVTAVRGIGRPDVIGVWVGGGELEQRMRRLAALPGPPIVLAGERADVAELLPGFDAFLLPSRYEGLPTVVVEAMACGVPVAASAVNAVPDVVVPGQTGLLVPPRRPDLMAAAARHLLDHPARASRMAAAARARLGDRHSLAALASALVEAYAPDAAVSGAAARDRLIGDLRLLLLPRPVTLADVGGR